MSTSPDNENTIRLIFRNTLSLGAAQFITQIIGMIIGILVIRYLGDEQFGSYAIAYSFCQVWGVLCDVGLSQLLVREASRKPHRIGDYVGTTLIIKLFISIVMYAAMIAIAGLLDYSRTTFAVITIMGIVAIVQSFNYAFFCTFQALKRLEIPSIFMVATNLAILAAGFILIVSGGDVVDYAWMYAIATIGVNIILLVVVFRIIKPKIVLNIVFPFLRSSIVFGLTTLFFTVYYRSTPAILGALKTESDAGIFSSAHQLFVMSIILPNLITPAIMPVLYEYKSDIARLKPAFLHLFRLLSLLGLFTGMCFAVCAEDIIHLLFNNKFPGAEIILRILGFALVFRYISYSLSMTVTAMDWMGRRVVIQGIVACVNIALCFILIPRFSARGAGFVTLISEILLCVLYVILVRTFLDYRFLSSILKLLSATVVASFVLFLINSLCHVIVVIPIIFVIFFILLVVLRFFNEEDMWIWSNLPYGKKVLNLFPKVFAFVFHVPYEKIVKSTYSSEKKN